MPHEIDRKTRLRIAANLRMLKHRFEFATDAAMAEKLDVSRGVVNRALKGERTVGLDFLLKVHRNLHASIDWLVDNEPAQDWYDPGFVPKSSRRA
jgi:transcriptional regulator with XRE-family HTH domain